MQCEFECVQSLKLHIVCYMGNHQSATKDL